MHAWNPVHRVTCGEGFDPDFLHHTVDFPKPSEAIRGDLLVWEGGTVLPYTHFSLTVSISRRFAYWVAWNIDGGVLKRLSRRGISFALDPRIPADAQIGNDLYAGNRLDRGHLARRADLTWGPMEEAVEANTDSFTYTNIAPQMEDFNQSGRQGLWGRLEDALYEDLEIDSLKVSVMAGPVFGDDDQCTGAWASRRSIGRSWPTARTGSSTLPRSCSPRTWTGCVS